MLSINYTTVHAQYGSVLDAHRHFAHELQALGREVIVGRSFVVVALYIPIQAVEPIKPCDMVDVFVVCVCARARVRAHGEHRYISHVYTYIV